MDTLVISKEEEAAPGPETKYAEDRVTLAKEQQPAADAKDYVDYLMADPAMARAVAKNRTPVPGLTADEQGAVHGALRVGRGPVLLCCLPLHGTLSMWIDTAEPLKLPCGTRQQLGQR
jgi:hypothetical protein